MESSPGNEVALMIEDIFHHWDLNKSGYIEKKELKRCCSELRFSEEKLAVTFKELDADGDGKISLQDFAKSFQKVCSLFDVTEAEVLNQELTEYQKFEKLLDAIGVKGLLSGQEYVSELFHYMHNSSDSSQLLSLLESFLFSVVRDVKHYSSENAKLEDALKRTCEKHAEHMEQLDDELDQQMGRMEMRIKKEAHSKFERSNLDMVWQLENKNKEIQALNTRVQKLEVNLKKKEPEEQKLKEEIEEKVQELRYLRSQVTDAQTTVAVIRSELAQLKNDYEDQGVHLETEKRTVMECVQEQESLTRQLQLLHEANKKLHDTNDDLRSALEMRRPSDGNRGTPSPNKRNSMSTLYTPAPRPHKRSKSHEPSSQRDLTGEFTGDDRHPHSASASPSRSPLDASRRGSKLLPINQSCEVDELPVNEDSLLTELMRVQRVNNFPDGTEEEDEAYSTMPSSERESLRQQLELLQRTNSDLRTALEVVSNTRMPSKSRRSERGERGEKCRRNASIRSTHSDYGSISSRSMSPNRSHGAKSSEYVADGAEELSGYDPESDGNNTSTLTQTESVPDSDLSQADISELEAQFKSVIEEDEEDIDEDDVGDEELARLVAMATGMTDSEEETDTDEETTVGVREAAIGADSLSEASTNTALNASSLEERVPERMYKLVLAGDAAVGKSSFILRLCRNRFHSALNSTLGVDFQMKTLEVDGKTIALQLWDTAGQERFRSIAKSYFRKADGVLLLYDVTCETSFLDVRDWVEAIEESCSKPVPIMLCGNKIDLRQSYAAENKTVITEDSGRRLAKEHGALFMETSSKENRNIEEACVQLARMLRDVEDIEVKQNNGMKLTDSDAKAKKKSNCCPT